MEAASEPIPDLGIDILTGILPHIIRQLSTKIFVGHWIVRDAQNGELARKQIGFGQIVQSWNQLAASEVAGRAEDHHDARIGDTAWGMLGSREHFSLRHS